ncbi:MAG: KUP/HAK/KT family potassium transporter [Leptospiraceae bacterium]|nr:KUP/HAK/KT family potassium transporter [Leptospiraceae bacterium]
METPSDKPPSLLSDIRIIFATILTDPGSSLAYGADAVIAVTIVLFAGSFETGMTATLTAGGIVMTVYLIAVLAYNSMIRHHTHPVLGGGAFVSSLITSQHIRRHPRLKAFIHNMGKLGTASLLADFPATQAISLIAGVEALHFVYPDMNRVHWALVLVVLLSLIQRYGLGNLSRFMIWPVLAFYISNVIINLTGIITILENGWHPPVIGDHVKAAGIEMAIPVILASVANGATLMTGVEVGYSSVNIPYHKGKAIRISMWILFSIVLCTYFMQLINFMGLGIVYNDHIPVPIAIAEHLGGHYLATSFGIITAIMLLLAAQTAQTDFPLEMLRAARSRFFPRGVGDMAWKKTRPAFLLGGHEGVYNPRATIILGILSAFILWFFPSSHAIEGMYGLAVVAAMNIDLTSYFLRQIRTRKISLLTIVALLAMHAMLWNITYNKFFEGAWFIVVLMLLYFIVFQISEAIYEIWEEKLKVVPLELGLWYPAFQNHPVNRKHIVLVSKFHPGVVHFLRNFVRSGQMPLVVHFRSDPGEEDPQEMPEWFLNVNMPPDTDTITAINQFVRDEKPERVHLIPLMVRGIGPILNLYFGNSIERLKYAISRHADLQVEYNRERIVLHTSDILLHIFPFLPARWFRVQEKLHE